VDEVREARPDDLELSLVWDEDDEGGLAGHLRARNIAATPVHLSGKPGLRPLGEDGAPLVACAVGNAIATLTSVRLHELPFAPERVRGALGA